MTKVRLLVAQGPTQLMAALMVWVYRDEGQKNQINYQNILLLGDFHADAVTSTRLEVICRQIARAGDFHRTVCTSELDSLFYQGAITFEEYAVRIGRVVGSAHVDEVFVCRNMQLLNEAALWRFPDARKVCFGDGFGNIDINSTSYVKPYRPSGYVQVDEIACVMPVESSNGAFEQAPVTIVPTKFFTKTVEEVAAQIDGLEDVCQKIMLGSKEQSALVCLANLTESACVKSLDDEIPFYLESLGGFAAKDVTIFVKGHPRETFGQSALLTQRLSELGYDARRFEESNMIPLECLAVHMKVSHFMALLSSSAPGWRLMQPRSAVTIGVPKNLIDRYIPENVQRMYSLELNTAANYVTSFMATRRVFQPIRLSDVKAQLHLAPGSPFRLEGVSQTTLDENHSDTFGGRQFLDAVLTTGGKSADASADFPPVAHAAVKEPSPDCPLCFSKQHKLVDTIPTRKVVADWRATFGIDVAAELAAREHIELYRCQNCHLQFFPSDLAGSGRLYAQLQGFDWYYMPRKWEHDVAMRDIRKGARVLEVGSGRGDFMDRLLIEKQVDGFGIELNQTAVEEARSLGRPVYLKSLEEVLQKEPSGFDVICSFQVLEHLSDPGTFLRQSARLLRPGGKLVLGVPNADSFLKYQYNLLDMPPHHVTRWSRKCLTSLPSVVGLRLSRLAMEPLPKYHVDCYVEGYAGRMRRHRFSSLLANSSALHRMRQVLRRTPVNRLLRGQSVYACYTTE